ncbi:hypothetical protein JCM10213_007085 [Rhodosporidiobolus nylandii]
MDRKALQEATRVLRFGSKEEMAACPDAEEVKPGDEAVIKQIKDGALVFVTPPTRVTAPPVPKIIPPALLDSIRVAVGQGQRASWTWEHETIWAALTEQQWVALFLSHFEETAGAAEWDRRAYVYGRDAQGRTTIAYIGDSWTLAEGRANQARLKEQERQFMNFYNFYHNTLPHDFSGEDGKASLPPYETPAGPRQIWVEPRVAVDLEKVKLLDAAGYTNALWVIRFGHEPSAGSQPFLPDTHATEIATGQAVLPYPPTANAPRNWPHLLSPSTSYHLLSAHRERRLVPWSRALESLYAAQTAEEWERLNMEQWEDWLAIGELTRRYASFRDSDTKRNLSAAEERYKRRREDCLALYELRYQHSEAHPDSKLAFEADGEDDEEFPPPSAFQSVYTAVAETFRTALPPVVPPPAFAP